MTLQSILETQLSRHELWQILQCSLELLIIKKRELQLNSIKDLHRLGKYNSGNTKLHPLLVKFLSLVDEINVLSNRVLFKSPKNIKPAEQL